MHLEGTLEVAASRDRVQAFLADPRNVASCVPGSPPVEQLDATHYRTAATVGSGFLRTKASLELAYETAAPERTTVLAHGAAAGGTVEATLTWALSEPEPVRTLVAWSAEVTLGGVLASFASGLEVPLRAQLERVLACVRARLESAA